MAFNPKIDNPCPYKNNLSAVMDGDFCTMCKRNVFDLNGMNDEARQSFLASCSTEVCVSYTLPVKQVAAIAAAAALLTPLPLAAQDSTAPAPAMETGPAMEDVYEYDMIIVGGIKDPKATAQKAPIKAAPSEDKNLTELPVIDETDMLQNSPVKPVHNK